MHPSLNIFGTATASSNWFHTMEQNMDRKAIALLAATVAALASPHSLKVAATKSLRYA